MTTQIKLAATLASSFVLGWIGLGALHAQLKPKYRQPFGLPRHWRCLIKQHFSTSLKPCLRHFSLLMGNTSFLAGRLHPERDRRLVELQLSRSIAWKKRSSGSIVPQPPRRAPKPKSSPKYAATSSKALPSKLADCIPHVCFGSMLSKKGAIRSRYPSMRPGWTETEMSL